MKIVRLEAENFKRIRAVAIEPSGALQQITGRNAQGKSSILDAIWAALGGKAASPDKPIREGEKRASVTVDLGELVVTRRWRGDKSELHVETRDGDRKRSPQEVLDRLVGDLSFDPLAFAKAKAPMQAQALRAIAGLDTTLLDGQRLKVFAGRTEANRQLKAEQARLDAMPEHPDAPDEPVSVKALLAELEAARANVRDRDRKLAKLEQARAAAKAADEAFEAARKRCYEAKDGVDLAEQVFQQHGPLPDTFGIEQRIGESESVNERVRAKKAREGQVAVVAGVADMTNKLTAQLDEIDARKAELLAGAKFPVPGLSVDGDVPTFNGVPLSQASGAEQLRVSLAVAAALNPRLKVLLVRDGSLLDAAGLELVAKWAEERGMQVWLERVADGPGAGVLIEDGTVVGAEQAAVEAPVGVDSRGVIVHEIVEPPQIDADGDVDLGGDE